MKKVRWLKVTLSTVLALSVLAAFLLPAFALGGTDVNISSLGAGSPDIEVSGNGHFVAVAYYKQADAGKAVYVKSSTLANGWLNSTLVGFGSNPQLTFKADSNDTVYVVWAKSDGTAIQSSECVLDDTTPPVCTTGSVDVQTASAGSLETPDVVVSSSGVNKGVIHVAWVNQSFIETARSTAANSLSAWSSPVIVSQSGGGNDQKPVIAWSSDRLHLAFLRGATPKGEYFYSSDTSHSWISAQEVAANITINGVVHDYIDNPTIAASAGKVFMAFDAHRSLNNFSLIETESVNNGTSWSAPTFAPDTSDLNPKVSQENGVPTQETGLRPSLTISGSSAALAWQQIPFPVQCGSPSTIYFAGQPTGAGVEGLSNDGDDDYMIDPDLAVRGTDNHFIFMRDADIAGCSGGEAPVYVITYRGPFTTTTNDGGEGNNGVYLPIIKKNS